MNRSEIEEKVRLFLTEDLEIEDGLIKPENRLKEDIGIGSLDFVDIVVFIDKYFGIQVQPNDMKGIDTLEQFCDYIEAKLPKD